MKPAVCGYYGKLPLSPEFLRLHASGPELRWLDEWLQQGVVYAKAQEGTAWQERLAHASPYSFFYVPGSEGRVVSGVLIASQDKAGRSFPFMSFVLMNRDSFSSLPWLIPVATAQFLDETLGAIRTLRDGLDWDVFCRAVEQRQVEEPSSAQASEALDRFTRSTTVGEWWFDEPAALEEVKRVAVGHLLQKVAQARCQGEPNIRLPIGSDGSFGNLDLSFLLQLCLEHHPDVAHSHTGFLCFWKREVETHGGTALLSIGPGSPKVLRFIVNPVVQDDLWWDVTAHAEDLAEESMHKECHPRSVDLQDSLATASHVMRKQMERE